MGKSKEPREPKKMGRPILEIDWETFQKLLEYQASLEEVAAWFKMSPDTVETRVKEKFGRTFSDVSKEFRGVGKLSLRRKQFQEAMKGNTKLLIWLGKQYLEQRDKREDTVNITNYSDDELLEKAKEIL